MKSARPQILSIRAGTTLDLNALRGMQPGKEHGYFERQFEMQTEGSRLVLIASLAEQDAGYCLLNWRPKYGFFKTHNIPEIQDLNVRPGLRRRGVATALIRHCEDMARDKGHAVMGISFGLDASYGPAQKLYIREGYAPDGYGATYDRKTVAFGEFRPVDDNLCLMLVKNLTD